ncbi:SAM-dependent methyltransferase [Planosporangium sp. 12N6]|uniref:SAM-dependent methyltransferase n=1 Tax=Planosporangium spinosum TaxID=3402278 RepID=UPI003CF258AC
MQQSLYGPGGFFTGPGPGPAGHFRTSAHASPAFADAVATLVGRADTALGHPDRLDLVDVGGGRGELVTAVLSALPDEVAARVRPTVVELAPRPSELDARVGWLAVLPDDLVGVVVATEWLDNVPLDVVEVDDVGQVRYVLVDPDGQERLGPMVEPADAAWLARWWPVEETPPGTRAEVGAPRDAAWEQAVRAVHRGFALAVDYGHLSGARPAFGTLTGFRAGRQVLPVPDRTRDLTAHVAFDSVAAAGAAAAGVPPRLSSQRDSLRALGVGGDRPPLALAHTDPQAYLRALAEASVGAELTDPAGLGGHYWLLQPVGLSVEALIR